MTCFYALHLLSFLFLYHYNNQKLPVLDLLLGLALKQMAMNRSTWQDIAHRAQSHRARTLAQVQPPLPDVPSHLPRNVTAIPQALLSPREVEITMKSVEELVASLATGRLSSTEVTSAFLRRAGLAQKLVFSLPLVFGFLH